MHGIGIQCTHRLQLQSRLAAVVAAIPYAFELRKLTRYHGTVVQQRSGIVVVWYGPLETDIRGQRGLLKYLGEKMKASETNIRMDVLHMKKVTKKTTKAPF